MAINKEPMISVIIPTRERVETLLYTLRTALQQNCRCYEVLVSDNASQDGTQARVSTIDDNRVRYINTRKRVSMCDNWEFALQHARGKYVIFIGDDDALMPGALDWFERLVTDSTEEVFMWTTSTYVWPIDDNRPRIEFVGPVGSPTTIDLQQKARFVITHGGWKYYEIPGVYHTAVARQTLDSIRAKTGRVFHSTNPDIFTSMALPALVRTAVHTGRPVSIQGRSAKSNGGAGVARDGAANVNRFLQEFGKYEVHPTLVPDVNLVANCMPDAILLAKDKFPEFYGELSFNYDAMWAFMYRLRLMKKLEVVRLRKRIREFHHFSVPRFLYFAAIHDAALFRRRVLNRTTDLGPFAQGVPDNIFDFAVRLAEWQNGSDCVKAQAEFDRSC